MNKRKIKSFFRLLFPLLVVMMVAGIVLNRQWIYDWFRGITYAPSNEMAAIYDSLDLAEKGDFLFRASHPELDERDAFNEKCRDDDSEMAILGCYTEGSIYVYNIAEGELGGIRELTAAHELLHAVYARMLSSERESLRGALEQVYENHKDVLEDELGSYGETERYEELYVRVGTEIKNLPEILEKHYAEIFTNQDALVDYYENYIAVFKTNKENLERIMGELETLGQEIEQKTSDYEKRASQLEADILSFNSCAEVSGCFKDEESFLVKRNALVGEQNELEVFYNGLNGLIDQYNAKVEEYNAEVIYNEKLNNIINSSEKPRNI